MSNFQKITHGFVVQNFDITGEFVSQEFVAGDLVEYLYDGSEINVEQMPLCGNEYEPFHMNNYNEAEIAEWCENSLFGNRIVDGKKIPLTTTQETVKIVAAEVIKLWCNR